jgi:UPF0716 protein FxsA
MGLILLLAMIGVPILEIAVFIEAGERIGLWPTLGAVILTAVVGTALLRLQGLSTLARARESLEAGQLPVAEVFDGICLLIGGALLLTPGFVTDAVGFLLLIPPVRHVLRQWFRNYLTTAGRVQVWSDAPSADPGPAGSRSSPIIDGEFEEVVDENGRSDAGNGEDRRNEGVVPAKDSEERR